MKRQRAFTLIELLVVIAIILILIAIALPNFLDSQMRAKYVRAVSDMRSLAIAAETYQTDWRAYPPYGRVSPEGVIQYPATVNSFYDKMCFIGSAITSPVPYIHQVPVDLFAELLEGPEVLGQLEYLNLDQHVGNFPDPPPPYAPNLIPAWGHWRMVAAGPDGDRGQDIKENRVYAPTNGVRSDGDIVRCQRFQDNRPSRPIN